MRNPARLKVSVEGFTRLRGVNPACCPASLRRFNPTFQYDLRILHNGHVARGDSGFPQLITLAGKYDPAATSSTAIAKSTAAKHAAVILGHS